MTDQDPHRPARRLLLGRHTGVLSTLSVALEGHPFGSVVPYCLDYRGIPAILISDIAQHTKNLDADPRASLTLVERTFGEVQAGARLTCLVEGRRLESGAAVAERYYRYFPTSRGYHRAHGFAFYALEPVRFRYIGGFGDIRWIEPAELLAANPFSAEQESAIVDHMNVDHREAIDRYLELFGIAPPTEGETSMLGLDSEGIDLAVADRIVRLPFAGEVTSPEEARGELVRLARAESVPQELRAELL